MHEWQRGFVQLACVHEPVSEHGLGKLGTTTCGSMHRVVHAQAFVELGGLGAMAVLIHAGCPHIRHAFKQAVHASNTHRRTRDACDAVLVGIRAIRAADTSRVGERILVLAWMQ